MKAYVGMEFDFLSFLNCALARMKCDVFEMPHHSRIIIVTAHETHFRHFCRKTKIIRPALFYLESTCLSVINIRFCDMYLNTIFYI